MQFTEQAMRPPQEAQSLLIRATQGCTYNNCRFCYVSRGHPFIAASATHMEQEAAGKKDRFPPDTKIYLVGSNPFALPSRKLEDYAAVLRRHFPAFAEMSMQAMVRDIAAKSMDELSRLRDAGISHLYIGVENGNNDALALMTKGHTAEEAVTQLLRLDEAGIAYTAFYVLGLAGKGQGRKSGKATAAMFNRVRPRRITTTGLTVFPGTPLESMALAGEFTQASEREKIEELRVFLEELTTHTFFDAVHYLNPLTYRFATPGSGKNEALADIDDVLATHNDEEIEMMVSRHLMRTL